MICSIHWQKVSRFPSSFTTPHCQYYHDIIVDINRSQSPIFFVSEEFYSTTAIKDDFEPPKKITHQPRYEDEDCDIDVTEVDAHGDREISRYRKRKKTPR